LDTSRGTYNFHVQPVVDSGPTPITLGNVVNGTIEDSGYCYIYTCTLPDLPPFPTRRSSDLGSLLWSLVGPRGTEVSNRSFNGSDAWDVNDSAPVTIGGRMTPSVGGTGDTAGAAYSFRLSNFASATAITPGTPVVGTLNPANE